VKIFVDTSILIRALDPRYPERRTRARQLFTGEPSNRFVLSTQVLQEFYAVAVRRCGVESLRAKRVVRSLDWMEVVTINGDLTERAIDIQVLNEISFWDSLVIAAAGAGRCAVVWSEEMTAGQVVSGVRIENPLSPLEG